MTSQLSVQVTRGGLIESNHNIQAIFLDQNRKVIFNQKSSRRVFPRSAIKILQAIPFIQSKAIDQFNLTAKHIALSCASHNADLVHIETAIDWIKKLKKTEKVLLCGHHRPMGSDNSKKILKLTNQKSPILNNCSGKHLGMISRCLVDSINIKEYLSFNSQHQIQIFEVLESLFEAKIENLTRDGCHAPMFSIPLKSLALAALKVSNHEKMIPQYSSAIEKSLISINRYPCLTAGQNQFDSNIIKATKGRIYFKRGAEGIGFVVDRKNKIGGAIKVEDGNMRALPIATLALLNQLKLINKNELHLLKKWSDIPILNCNKFEVGKISVA